MTSARFGFVAGVITCALMMATSAALAADDELDPTWVRPGTDFSKYSKFRIKPLVIDDVRITRPPWAKDDPKEWSLEFRDLEAIQNLFQDAMDDVLEADNGYPVVYGRGDDVIVVEVEILSIMPYVRPGSSGDSDGYQITTLGSGELTAQAELRDSQSRELLVLIEGETVIGTDYKEWSQENNIANLNSIFRDFAKRLRGAMDRIHGK